MSLPFRIEKGKPALVLAPMEGVTDAPMRAYFGWRGGFDLSVSEFFRISQTVPSMRVIQEHMPECLTSGFATQTLPVQLQLLGGDANRLAEAAQRGIEAGSVNGIDLNFGCPAPTVNRHDGGASLLRDPSRLSTIIRSVRQAVPATYPVSAKIRLGWSDPAEAYDFIKSIEEAGAAWITVHARTRLAGYAPPAFWPNIRRLQESVSVPVVANGEIWTLEDFERCRTESGAEHFMLGRGVVANPDLVLQIREILLGSVTKAIEETWKQRFIRFRDLSETILPGSPEIFILKRLKQWARVAAAKGADIPFEKLKRTQGVQEFISEI